MKLANHQGDAMRVSHPLEMWAGVECTVNRVGNSYLDQIDASGHAERVDDLHAFCDLGVKAIRYPVLWERTQPDSAADANWLWSDARLGILRQRQVRPIVGLVHHGSGPPHTGLTQPCFPEKVAKYASAVAKRYPWVDAYTPINEPHTTARFSALYGHWYPHACDARLFAQALIMQCRAVVLAMRAIRQVNSAAQLIQTDDLGKTFSTPALAYQTEFDNERRWISWDLLTGRVGRDHALWSYFAWCGVDLDGLAWMQDNPCPPDMLGVNHYVTSDRFLDERLDRYPACAHGGNSRTSYADVEAVRVLAHDGGGIGERLQEAWDRYHLPIAVTEVHLGCHREEQLRWLDGAWSAAEDLRSRGVDIRAVTAWSLLGAYDWDSLLTQSRGYYEPGVFDLRGGTPRPTALAAAVKSLARGVRPNHPSLQTEGWWRRPNRLSYLPAACPPKAPAKYSAIHGTCNSATSPRPILIAGADGRLGRAFVTLCAERGLASVGLNRDKMDITNAADVNSAFQSHQPWAVINAAGYTKIDGAEQDPEGCYLANVAGANTLAEACLEHDAALVCFSSNHVFDGNSARPYVETDTPAPLNVYGKCKYASDKNLMAIMPSALIVRTNSLFSPWDATSFVAVTIGKLRRRERVRAAEDAVSSVTYVPDLIHATLDLLVDSESGVWHLSHDHPATWMTLAQHIASVAGVSDGTLEPCLFSDLAHRAAFPRYSALGSERGLMLPSLEHALTRYAATQVS